MSTTQSDTIQLDSVNVEPGDGGQVTLQIEVAPAAVRAAREAVVKDLSRQIRIPGFRPGHIPANIIRRRLGDEAIAQRVSDQLVPIAFEKAMKQKELEPLERAQVDQLTFDAFAGDEPLRFSARLVVRPRIELGELKGLVVNRPVVELKEEEIDTGLEELRAEHGHLHAVEDRPAQEGDVVSGELQVYIDGRPHFEQPVKLNRFVLGEGTFVPRLDEQLIGAELDQERRFQLTFPSDYQDEELAGQAAEFAVTITSLQERHIPELDDEFAKTMHLPDMAALRERMAVVMTQDRERQSRQSERAQLLKQVVERAQFEVPARLVDKRTQQRIHQLEHDLGHRKQTLDEYLERIGQTREQLEAEVRTREEADVRQELVLAEIARREELPVSDEEIEQHYRMMAATLQQPVEQLVQSFDVNAVRASILESKAVDWLLEHAEVREE